MKTLRRIDLRERLYFLTVVADGRRDLLLKDMDIFWQSWDKQEMDAWIILPEHFHIMLANGDQSISEIIHRFKRKYSTRYAFKFGTGRVWQNRFWDHIIRDKDDYHRHLDYIHYNPVKHGLVKRAHDYPHSSIRKFTDWYPEDWGVLNDEELNGDFGEYMNVGSAACGCRAAAGACADLGLRPRSP